MLRPGESKCGEQNNPTKVVKPSHWLLNHCGRQRQLRFQPKHPLVFQSSCLRIILSWGIKKKTVDSLWRSQGNDAYRERECEDQGHREDDPPGISSALESPPYGNDWRGRRRIGDSGDSREGNWEIGKLPELHHICKYSNRLKIPRQRC